MSQSTLNRPINLSYCSFAPRLMDVRIGQPNVLLKAHGFRVEVSNVTVKAPRNIAPDEPKIIVIQRMLPTPGEWQKSMKEILKRGWLVVMEVDDYPLDTGLKVNANKWENSMGWEGFSCCHGVQVSTDVLADIIEPYNSETKVFGNHLFQVPPLAKRTDDNVRIFFGALNRKDDWKELLPVFNRIGAKYPNVQFVTLFDREFYNAIESPNKSFSDVLEYMQYQQLMSKCDIAIMPLQDTRFKRCKSDIKFVEAGGASLAVVASPTVYENSIRHGETGLIARSESDWEDMLVSLIENDQMRKDMGYAARQYVLQERMLIQHIHKRVDWYQSLWDRREDLTAALIERFPEVAPD